MLTTLLIIEVRIALDCFIYRVAKEVWPLHWGRIPERAQYALFLLAVSFTWLMGLMGYARSGIRQHWHVWEVMRDTSDQAVTPALGYAANMISACVVIFLVLVAFIFWLGGLAERSADKSKAAVGNTPQPQHAAPAE